MYRQGLATNQQVYDTALLSKLSDFYKERLNAALEKTDFIHQFKKHFPDVKAVRILSIGSGPHPIEIAAMQSLLQEHGLTIEYHGIEYDAGAIEKSRSGYSRDNIHFHQVNATDVQKVLDCLNHQTAHFVIMRHPVLNPSSHDLSKTFRDILIRVLPKILAEHGCVFVSNYMDGEHDVAANILQAINSSNGFFDLEACVRDFKINENGFPLFPEQFFLGIADFRLSLVAKLFNAETSRSDHKLNQLIEKMQSELETITDPERIALFTHIISITLSYQINSDFALLIQAVSKELSNAIVQLNLHYNSINIPYDKEMGIKNTNVSGRQYLLMENLIMLCDEIRTKPEYLNSDVATREKYLLNIIRLVAERPYGVEFNANQKINAAELYRARSFYW